MNLFRRLLGDDLALQQAIKQQTAAITALTDRLDERTRTQSDGLHGLGDGLDKALTKQAAGIDLFGTSIKESLRSQEEALSAFANRLEAGLERQADGLAKVSRGISDIKAYPLPVQTFPLIEDTRWEEQKRNAAHLAEQMLGSPDNHFIALLADAEKTVRTHTQTFFKEITHAADSEGDERRKAVRRSLDNLLACSPKKIIASYQRHALEVGWSYIYTFNRMVDGLAEWYPRCRSGIYASRLKYSDVIQVTEEVMATLRACSTLLEDLQRRYDLLEALQASVQADCDDPACDKIWRAFKATLAECHKFFGESDEDDGLVKRALKKLGGIVTVPGQATAAMAAATTAQFNEQMARDQRLMVFIKTAGMFCEAWEEWQDASRRIVAPNLKVLFALKRDYVRHQVLCMCDLANYNSYPMDGVCDRLLKLGSLPNIITTWRKHNGPSGTRTCTLREDGTFAIADEPDAQWGAGRWKWDSDVLVFAYRNDHVVRHVFHGPDTFSELHNDSFWYERIGS